MASNGYPVKYAKGFEITIPDEISENVIVAGAAEKDGKLVTSGGRVLAVTATAKTLSEALKIAYERTDRIHFEGAFCRRDIGARALLAKEN